MKHLGLLLMWVLCAPMYIFAQTNPINEKDLLSKATSKAEDVLRLIEVYHRDEWFKDFKNLNIQKYRSEKKKVKGLLIKLFYSAFEKETQGQKNHVNKVYNSFKEKIKPERSDRADFFNMLKTAEGLSTPSHVEINKPSPDYEKQKNSEKEVNKKATKTFKLITKYNRQGWLKHFEVKAEIEGKTVNAYVHSLLCKLFAPRSMETNESRVNIANASYEKIQKNITSGSEKGQYGFRSALGRMEVWSDKDTQFMVNRIMDLLKTKSQWFEYYELKVKIENHSMANQNIESLLTTQAYVRALLEKVFAPKKNSRGKLVWDFPKISFQNMKHLILKNGIDHQKRFHQSLGHFEIWDEKDTRYMTRTIVEMIKGNEEVLSVFEKEAKSKNMTAIQYIESLLRIHFTPKPIKSGQLNWQSKIESFETIKKNIKNNQWVSFYRLLSRLKNPVTQVSVNKYTPPTQNFYSNSASKVILEYIDPFVFKTIDEFKAYFANLKPSDKIKTLQQFQIKAHTFVNQPFSLGFGGHSGKVFVAMYAAGLIDAMMDPHVGVSEYLELWVHAPQEVVRFITVSLGAGSVTYGHAKLVNLLEKKLMTGTASLNAETYGLTKEMFKTLQLPVTRLVAGQLSFIAGMMVNKLIYEGWHEHAMEEVGVEALGFVIAETTTAKAFKTLISTASTAPTVLGAVIGLTRLTVTFVLYNMVSKPLNINHEQARLERAITQEIKRINNTERPKNHVCSKKTNQQAFNNCVEEQLIHHLNRYLFTITFRQLEEISQIYENKLQKLKEKNSTYDLNGNKIYDNLAYGNYDLKKSYEETRDKTISKEKAKLTELMTIDPHMGKRIYEQRFRNEAGFFTVEKRLNFSGLLSLTAYLGEAYNLPKLKEMPLIWLIQENKIFKEAITQN